MKIKNELEKILSRLVSFKTVSSDFAENGRLLDYIEKEVGDNLFVQRFNSNGYPSLIASSRRTNKPKLALVAHGDVVSGSDKLFKSQKEGSKLFGRGAFDMKFAIACYLLLNKEIGKRSKDYDYAIILTSDEELGGSNGIMYILDKGFQPEICFLPDGGQNWDVQRAAKGVIHLRIESRGTSVHGSRTWQGVNAIDNLVSFTDFLRYVFPKEPCGQKDHFHSTINLGKIEGGTAANQVPDFATALVDIRFIPGKDKERILKRIENGKKKFKGVNVKEISFGDSFEINIKDPAVYEFLKIVKEVTSISPKFIISHGSSDARYFAKRNIPVIATRPKGGGHHGEKEWIDLDDLDRFYLVLKRYVEKAAWPEGIAQTTPEKLKL